MVEQTGPAPIVLAIVGSYREEGITDSAVGALLAGAASVGAQTKVIYLRDRRIEFCINCRVCNQEELPDQRRGVCVLDDELDRILGEVDRADALILAAPVNFSTVTALMKRFAERLIVYAYWPWGKLAPKSRIKKSDKLAVLVTSSATPAFIGRWLMPNALSVLRQGAKVAGAKVIKKLYFGGVSMEKNQKLREKALAKAHQVGIQLARSSRP